jgi:hypothetical protein
MKPKEVEFTMYDSEDREVLVKASYSPPTPDYFSKSFGNWLPGEDGEVEIQEIIAVNPEANLAEFETEAKKKQIEEEVVEYITECERAQAEGYNND